MKPRSQRQFRSDPMNTPDEWAQVAHSPQVQRMLEDPQLANALYQNFRQTGGNVPQLPTQMQSGGGVPTPEQVNQIDQMRGGDIDPTTENQLEQLTQDTRSAPRMADGGAISLDDADYMNEIAQELNDPNTAPARKQALRNKLAQIGRAPRISMPQPIERARGGPMRFAVGGETEADLDSEQQAAQATMNDPNADAASKQKARDQFNRIQQRRMQLLQQSTSPTAGGGAAQGAASQGVSFGPNVNIPGSAMSGLGKLGAPGSAPPTFGNVATPTVLGALMGGAGTGSAPGALIGAATAGLLTYFLRKHAQQQQKAQQQRMQSPTQGAQNYGATTGGSGVADNPNVSNAGQSGSSGPDISGDITSLTEKGLPAGAYPAGKLPNISGDVTSLTEQGLPAGAFPSSTSAGSSQATTGAPDQAGYDAAKQELNRTGTATKEKLAALRQQYNIPDPGASIGASSTSSTGSQSAPPSGSGLWAGTYSGGNATSSNGQNWTDVKTGNPISSPVINQTQVGSFGGDQTVSADTSGQYSSLPTTSRIAPDLSELSSIDPSMIDDGMAKGGPVKPHGLATVVPVLHVMIAAVPKGKKKAMGGDIPQAERKPLKPKAVPPLRGPHNGYLLPHGRVQVPRGSGAAIKGKRFGGIF